MKPLDIVYVIWRDALGSSIPWESIDDVEKDVRGKWDTIETVGYFVYQDKRYLTLAQSVQFNKLSEPCKLGGVFSIPTGCIIKMRKVSGPIKRKH
jgi:hypothetical protein